MGTKKQESISNNALYPEHITDSALGPVDAAPPTRRERPSENESKNGPEDPQPWRAPHPELRATDEARLTPPEPKGAVSPR